MPKYKKIVFLIYIIFNADFSLYVFSWLITCCLFYIYFWLWRWCLTKSEFECFIFYLNSKWVIKQWRQLATSTMCLAPGTTNECTVQWWFKKFCKGDRALKMRSTVASHWKLTRTKWEQSSKLILLQLQEKLLKNSMMTVLWLFGIWSTLERWKSSVSGYLNSWPQIKNTIVLNCCVLLEFYAMMNHFSTRLWHATKSGFYTTTGDDQLSG